MSRNDVLPDQQQYRTQKDNGSADIPQRAAFNGHVDVLAESFDSHKQYAHLEHHPFFLAARVKDPKVKADTIKNILEKIGAGRILSSLLQYGPEGIEKFVTVLKEVKQLDYLSKEDKKGFNPAQHLTSAAIWREPSENIFMAYEKFIEILAQEERLGDLLKKPTNDNGRSALDNAIFGAMGDNKGNNRDQAFWIMFQALENHGIEEVKKLSDKDCSSLIELLIGGGAKSTNPKCSDANVLAFAGVAELLGRADRAELLVKPIARWKNDTPLSFLLKKLSPPTNAGNRYSHYVNNKSAVALNVLIEALGSKPELLYSSMMKCPDLHHRLGIVATETRGREALKEESPIFDNVEPIKLPFPALRKEATTEERAIFKARVSGQHISWGGYPLAGAESIPSILLKLTKLARDNGNKDVLTEKNEDGLNLIASMTKAVIHNPNSSDCAEAFKELIHLYEQNGKVASISEEDKKGDSTFTNLTSYLRRGAISKVSLEAFEKLVTVIAKDSKGQNLIGQSNAILNLISFVRTECAVGKYPVALGLLPLSAILNAVIKNNIDLHPEIINKLRELMNDLKSTNENPPAIVEQIAKIV